MLKITYGPRIDYQLCTGCTRCYEYCPMDIIGWDSDAGRPTVDYPAECTLCCVCEIVCPEIAVDVRLPLHVMLDFGIHPRKAIRE
jgi:NAD-dependent dihydropyrimidine dehydrogenase PreA subunit